LGNSSIQCDISEFFVHIVNWGSRFKFKSNSISLNISWFSFEQFPHWKDLSLWWLNFVHSSQIIPTLINIKYQNLLLADTVFLPNTLIVITLGLASSFDGSLLPDTKYCLIYTITILANLHLQWAVLRIHRRFLNHYLF